MLIINGVSYAKYECRKFINAYDIRLYGKSVIEEIEMLGRRRDGIPIQMGVHSFAGFITEYSRTINSSGIYVDIKLEEVPDYRTHQHSSVDNWVTGIVEDKLNGENKMSKLEIETVTMINGQRSDEFDASSLVQLIQKQEEAIEKLSQIKAESKAIETLRKNHNENIKKLVEILDSRE